VAVAVLACGRHAAHATIALMRKSAAAARVEVEPVPHLPNLEART
jgi:hypothetical protein